MLIADMYGRQEKTINEVTLKNAVLIGCAQALALIPGTSRSGVTMTAMQLASHFSSVSLLRPPLSCSPWATP